MNAPEQEPTVAELLEQLDPDVRSHVEILARALHQRDHQEWGVVDEWDQLALGAIEEYRADAFFSLRLLLNVGYIWPAPPVPSAPQVPVIPSNWVDEQHRPIAQDDPRLRYYPDTLSTDVPGLSFDDFIDYALRTPGTTRFRVVFREGNAAHVHRDQL